jgi:hypothetical protein
VVENAFRQASGYHRMNKNLILSRCGQYRYALWRRWDQSLPYAMFIGWSPSASDETEETLIMGRYTRYATEWGCGGLCLVNLFARLGAHEEDSPSLNHRVGPENDHWIGNIAAEAGLIVGDWGSDGFFHTRSSEIIRMLPDINFVEQNQIRERLMLFLRQSLLNEPVPTRPLKVKHGSRVA